VPALFSKVTLFSLSEVRSVVFCGPQKTKAANAAEFHCQNKTNKAVSGQMPGTHCQNICDKPLQSPFSSAV